MAIEFEQVKALKEEHEDLYRARHVAFRDLRRYWQGDYWKLADRESRSIVSVFRDLTARTSDVGPDVKLVYNIIQMVCTKFQTYLTPLPQIRVYTDPPESDTRRAQAIKKQRFLYGTWSNRDMPMSKVFNRIGWYLPLMGDCFLGAIPDPNTGLITPVLRSPEVAYPIAGFDNNSEEAIIFAWKVRESRVRQSFPDYTPQSDRNAGKTRFFRRDAQEVDPKIEIIEYHDGSEWGRWIDGEKVNGVEHNFGFNLYEHLKFIDIPDDVWGHGAAEQAINLNEMGNALYSLMFQYVVENVFPRLVLEDPAKAPEEIETGPGAVLPLNPGGKAYWLSAPGPQNFEQFLELNEHNIKQATGMPEVNFGSSPASSIVTGKAVDALQGAGTGSMVEMVQGAGIGTGIVKWNEKAIRITQSMFRDKNIELYGVNAPNSVFDRNGPSGAMTIKGSQLIGSARNEVVFSPAISQHEKLVMGLQGLGAGVFSKKWVMENVGVPDTEAMDEEMLQEAVQAAVLGAILGQLQQQPTEQNAIDVERQAFAAMQGQVQATGPIPGAPPAALSPGAPPGPPGGGLPGLPPGQNQPPPAAGPPQGAGPAAPPPAPQAAAGGNSNTVTLEDAQAAFQRVQGIQGKVFLVGEIALRGQTDNDIEVAITNPADKQTLAAGLQQFAGRLVFHTITGQPNEPYVEVTPGQPPRKGGQVQASPEALRRVFVG